MAVYLQEKFEIGEDDPSLLGGNIPSLSDSKLCTAEIIQSMTSVGGATAIMAESLTKNVKKCSESQRGSGAEDAAGGPEPGQQNLHQGSDCPLMEGFVLNTNSSLVKFRHFDINTFLRVQLLAWLPHFKNSLTS